MRSIWRGMMSLALLAAASIASAAISDPVKIDAGLVSGAAGTSTDVRVFKGVPYAAPPVGALRWKVPQPAPKWDGVKAATAFGPRCMQGGGGAGGRGREGAPPLPPTSEDCLYVNVWTAASSASAKLPVMVWSYGGAFTGGAGSLPGYDGEALAKKGVVFVTYNYRLGPFGFFAHPELTKESGHNASGNYGVMDLAAALKWVQKNIAAFGGDPGRVTLVGESAGAALESVLVGSKEGKGLYQRVIAESASWSGVRMEKMQTLAEAEHAGKAGAEKIGASSLADLRAKTADEIMKMPAGRPIVDGWYVTDDLSATYAKGRQTDVDVLVGSNKDEAGFPFFGVPKGTAAEFVAQVKDRFGDRADAFLKIYPASTDVESNAAQLTSFNDEVAWNMRSWAASQAKQRKGKAYLYYFTRVPPANGNQPSRGAIHTAEIPYALGNAARNWTDADRALSETMTSYWVNFAATGNPNARNLPVWPEFKADGERKTMILGDKVEAGDPLDAARIALYDFAFARMTASSPATRSTAGN
jgi:para-nitrobenzyl esterase